MGPDISGGGATLDTRSTDRQGNISGLVAGGTCTIIYTVALVEESHVQLTLTGVSGAQSPFFRIITSNDTGFSVKNFSSTGTISFSYFVTAWN